MNRYLSFVDTATLYVFVVIFGTILMVVMGCQKTSPDGDFPEGDGDPLVVLFSASGSASVDVGSKANPFLENNSTVRVVAFRRANPNNPANLTNDAFVDQATYKVVGSAGALVPWTVDGTTGVATGSGTNGINMLLFKGDYDFYAYSPALELAADKKSVASIGHNIDFMGVELMGQAVSNSNKAFALDVFERKCSKVSFEIVPKAGEEASFTDLTATSVVLSGMAPSLGIALGDDITQGTGASGNTYTLGASNFTYKTSGDANKGDGVVGSGIVLPKSSGAVGIKFTLTINSSSYILDAPATNLTNIIFAKSQNYKFTVLVAARGVTLTLKITPWNGVTLDNPNLGEAEDDILIGSWSDIDWSGDAGGTHESIQVGTWIPVELPVDLGKPNDDVGSGDWGDSNQDSNDSGQGQGGTGTGDWEDSNQDNGMGNSQGGIGGGGWGDITQENDKFGENPTPTSAPAPDPTPQN